MLKLFGFLVAVICAVGFVNANEHVELIKELKAACISQTGITLEAVDKSRDGDFSDPKLDEFFYCIMQTGGFLDGNGKYLEDKIISKVVGIFGQEVGDTIRKECMKPEHGDGKVGALNFAKCFQKHGPEHDL